MKAISTMGLGSHNFVRQRDAMDCGPSCLAMIARYYGRQANLDWLRVRCSLGKEGVSLLGISKTAEAMGFKTLGGRLSFTTLTSEVQFPCIAHWEQNHFVVIYKGQENLTWSLAHLCRRPC